MTQVQNILSICCKLWIDKNKNLKVIKFETCVVNVLFQWQVKYRTAEKFIVKMQSFKSPLPLQKLLADIRLYKFVLCFD